MLAYDYQKRAGSNRTILVLKSDDEAELLKAGDVGSNRTILVLKCSFRGGDEHV